MKLVAQIKLLPKPEQAAALRETLRRCNAACDYIAAVAVETQTFRQFNLHHATYKTVRERFGLAANAAVRCVAKVAKTYMTAERSARAFRPLGGQEFDDRIFRFCGPSEVSIWTTSGRQRIPFVCGDRERGRLASARKTVVLQFVRGVFYLGVPCDVAAVPAINQLGTLGVDLGIANIAVDSDGTVYSGAEVDAVRTRWARRRASLQAKQTRAAKRRLNRLKGKQARFQRHTNHCISKAIVAGAERTGRGLALENLKGIRKRVTAIKRSQRARMSNWGFGQLRAFISYKAQLAGVPVVLVDPKYTSQACSCCGCIDKRNRPNQSTFKCVSCGYAALADYNAARNIRALAASKPAGGGNPELTTRAAQAA